jgi:hypothetical protein
MTVGAAALALAASFGCASAPRPKPVYVPISAPRSPVFGNDAIWVRDQFSAYSINRYVDPGDPAVMHDAHTLYRREETGRWNLAPSQSGAFVPAASTSAGGHDTTTLHDALTAELNRQRAASQALVEQAKILNQRLRELNAQSQEFHDALREFGKLREQQAVVSNRLSTIEGALRNLTPSTKAQ